MRPSHPSASTRASPRVALAVIERMFYSRRMRVEYRIEPCTVGADAGTGMPFRWSLNPYMGCVHRCTFCYVRHFEQRADRPSDDRYGRSIRVKTNVAEVLRRELARRSWHREEVALGTATDPYQPAEGRFRLTRACLGELVASGTPFSIVTRGPLVVRDVDVLADAAREVAVSVYLSLPTLDERVWRTTEPGTAPPVEQAARDPRARRRRDRRRRRAGADPSRPLRRRGAAPGSRSRGARGRRTDDLGQRRPSPARSSRALPRGARTRLAGAGRALRGAVRTARVPADRGRERRSSLPSTRPGPRRARRGVHRPVRSPGSSPSACRRLDRAGECERASGVWRSAESARTPPICG